MAVAAPRRHCLLNLTAPQGLAASIPPIWRHCRGPGDLLMRRSGRPQSTCRTDAWTHESNDGPMHGSAIGTRAWMFMEARLHLDEPLRGCSDTWMHGICSGTWMHGCMDVGMIVAWLRSARMHEWKGAWLHDAFFALGGFIVPRQYKMVCRFPNGSASPNIVPVC